MLFFTNFSEPIAQLSDVKDSNPFQGNLPLQYGTYLQTLILAKGLHWGNRPNLNLNLKLLRTFRTSIPAIVFISNWYTHKKNKSWVSYHGLKAIYVAYTHMPEGGSTYRVPPLGSYPSKQVCMCPYPSVHKSIAKIFNISSFYFNVLIRLPGLFKTKSLSFMFAYLVIFMPIVFHQLFVFLDLVEGHL